MVVERSEDAMTNQQPPQEEQRHARSSSYRVLGTLAAAQAEDSESEEDPMAWADLEEFGGTKKTLEKPSKKRAVKLTPEEVRAQLHELDEMEAKKPAAAPKKGVMHTIEWLKKHSHGDDDASARRRSHSSSFVRSVLGFFQGGGSRVVDHGDDASADATTDNQLVPLKAPWGQRALGCDWTTLGFALLNQPILDDMKRVRVVIESNELVGATAKALVALAKWLRLFDRHVSHVVTLKEYLLEERTLLAGVGYRVTTLYDSYKEALGAALELIHGDRRDLGDAILRTFADLEAVLTDELAAVKDVISQTLTEEQEYEALSQVFHHLSDDEACGVVPY
ncbi:hypothetical protein P43SY_005090 [Pythium insidiosum]|uniref:Uncharacterized protein n=1 Tax=Pythium insidiosum TaxID=114742 RepID=A0AAD5Q8X9_PYTIN|nr:hypothetical protein P43SY_005090 [Pythium insidiosum]